MINEKSDPTPAYKPFNFRYFFIFLLMFLLIRGFFDYQNTSNISYSQFKNYLEQGQVSKITLDGNNVTGQLKKPIEGKSQFTTVLVDKELSQQLEKSGVEYERTPDTSFSSTILFFLFPLFFFWFILYLFRKASQKGGGLG
nr:ATP-dependent metallopeptidase FtsH/Yme1/Tma family protein [Bdellovibrionales bacterium]